MKKVTDYLSEKSIEFFSAGPSKRQVLGGLIAKLDLPDPSAALKSILSREELGSTVIAPGLALPHTRVDGIASLQVAVGVCPNGVHDPQDGGATVKVYVLFVGPSDNMKEHLAFLAGVSVLFQKKGLVEKLAKLASPAGVLTALRDADK